MRPLLVLFFAWRLHIACNLIPVVHGFLLQQLQPIDCAAARRSKASTTALCETDGPVTIFYQMYDGAEFPREIHFENGAAYDKFLCDKCAYCVTPGDDRFTRIYAYCALENMTTYTVRTNAELIALKESKKHIFKHYSKLFVKITGKKLTHYRQQFWAMKKRTYELCFPYRKSSDPRFISRWLWAQKKLNRTLPLPTLAAVAARHNKATLGPKTIFYHKHDEDSIFKMQFDNGAAFESFLRCHCAYYMLDEKGNHVFSYSTLKHMETYKVRTNAKMLYERYKKCPKVASRFWRQCCSLVKRIFTKRFNYKRLPRPSSVQPWLILDETLKTNGCQNEYLWTPMETIYCEMFRNDPFRGTSVAPMALVGGKNTGKSKTLKDIAQMVNQNQTREIGVFYVSFGNDLEMSDGQDLLEAFCQRLVFCATAHWERIPTFESYHEAFSKFHKKNHNIIPWKIDKWLDGSHRILLIDDIDGIQKQLDANHTQAYKFGKFLKDNFVMNYGQYLVFSCQTDSAKEAFANILDTTSVQSSRTVHVQSLVQQKKTWD